ncbi:MAG: hypothetical protein IKQ56_00700 [Lachnospiraceae bacterium]|nr:hypothetical protein [Lachnospiraceae bacterium]
MMTAVGGYYNDNQIVMDESVNLYNGQREIITLLDNDRKPNQQIDLKKYSGRGEKTRTILKTS